MPRRRLQGRYLFAIGKRQGGFRRKSPRAAWQQRALRCDALEPRVVLSHCGPFDLGDGQGPRFIGASGTFGTTFTEDFSDNPNHEDPTTVGPGTDACEIREDASGNVLPVPIRLFTHNHISGNFRIIPAADVDLPSSEKRTGHVGELGAGTYEIDFLGIHPDFEVAAVAIDVAALVHANVTVIGTQRSLQQSTTTPSLWERLSAARGTVPPGSGAELGSILKIQVVSTSFDAVYFDDISIVIAERQINDPPIPSGDSVTMLPAYPTNPGFAVIDVLANDDDPEGGPLTLVSVTAPVNGTATIEGNAVRYEPNPVFHGSDSFEYTVRDAEGLTATATVSVFVNTPPPAPGFPDFVRPRSSPLLEVSAADGLIRPGFSPDVDGDELTVQLVTPPERGTLTLSPDGSFTYAPDNPATLQDDFFSFRYFDGFVPGPVGEARIGVPNEAPVAFSLSESFDHGAPGPWEGVLAMDPDGDPLEIEIVSAPAGLLEFFQDGRFRYQQIARDHINWTTGRFVSARSRFVGSESFTFRVRDQAAVSATHTISVQVVNTPPRTNVLVPSRIEVEDRFVVPTNDELPDPEFPPTILGGQRSLASGTLALFVHQERLDFVLDVVNLEAGSLPDGQPFDVSADLHLGSTALGGPVVANLFAGAPPTVDFSGRLASGSIAADDLRGPFENVLDAFSLFVDALRNGEIYVAIHTDDFPVGEIFGHIQEVPADRGPGVTVSAPGVLVNDIDHDFPFDTFGNPIDPDPLSAVLVDGPSHGAVTLRPDGSFTYFPDFGFTGLDGFR